MEKTWTKEQYEINGVTYTYTQIHNPGQIISLQLNHRTSILTVCYRTEVEKVDPADDWAWWDHLVEKYIQ